MSDIWDRTAAVMTGRPGMLATVAALFSFLPLAAQAVMVARLMPASATAFSTGTVTVAPVAAMRFGAELMAMGVLIAVFGLWGSLSLVAASSNPAVTGAGQAIGIGGRRLPVMLGLGLLLLLGVMVAAVPLGFVLGLAGAGYAVIGGTPPVATSGNVFFAGLSMLLILALSVWIFARLFLLVPIVVNERLGVGSFGRSWALTRGLALRLVGVLLLFFLVFAVASGAAHAVLGLAARILLGPDQAVTAQVVGQIAAAVVSAMLSVVVAVFSAQLYIAVTGREAAALE